MNTYNMQPATRQAQDLSMMKDRDSWPRWPLLPLKRSSKEAGVECGFLADDAQTTVFLGTVYELSSGPLMEAVKPLKALVYDSFEAIVRDGWTVD